MPKIDRDAQVKRHADTFQNFDTLPDSARVPVAIIANVQGNGVATIYRKARSGDLPAIVDGRMVVGEYRAHRAAPPSTTPKVRTADGKFSRVEG